MGGSTLVREGSFLVYSNSGWNVSQISREIGRSGTVSANFLRNPLDYGKERSTSRHPILDDRAKRRIIEKASTSIAPCAQSAAISGKKSIFHDCLAHFK